MSDIYFNPCPEQDRALNARNINGPVVVLHLLRFRMVADYAFDPEMAPEHPITGAEAFQRHIEHSRPHWAAVGGSVIFLGEGGPLLIGPKDERWDLAMMVRHANVQAFFAMASNEDWLSGLAHRRAAIEEARLLPLVETA